MLGLLDLGNSGICLMWSLMMLSFGYFDPDREKWYKSTIIEQYSGSRLMWLLWDRERGITLSEW